MSSFARGVLSGGPLRVIRGAFSFCPMPFLFENLTLCHFHFSLSECFADPVHEQLSKSY